MRNQLLVANDFSWRLYFTLSLRVPEAIHCHSGPRAGIYLNRSRIKSGMTNTGSPREYARDDDSLSLRVPEAIHCHSGPRAGIYLNRSRIKSGMTNTGSPREYARDDDRN